MKSLVNLSAGLVAVALLCVATISTSFAQTTGFASGAGTDSFGCGTKALPCRSILQAINRAGVGGVVTCLDAGPYSESFGYSDSLTVDCAGVVYPINSFGILVESGGGSPVITFRNVVFDGATGQSAVAVIVTSGGTVVFENCTFRNFKTSSNILAFPLQFGPTSLGAQLIIKDSLFLNNGAAAAGGGILIAPSGGGSAKVVIERTQVERNTFGIVANGSGGTALVEVSNSIVANNAIDGIWADSTGSTASIVVDHSKSLHNGGSGIKAQGAGAFVTLRDSTVAWNATGLTTVSGGVILSYQNNLIAGTPNPGVSPVSFALQ